MRCSCPCHHVARFSTDAYLHYEQNSLQHSRSKSKLRGEAGKSSSVIRRREFRLKIIGNTVQKQVTTDTGWGSDERGEIPFEFDYEKLGANDGVDGATKQREGALYE